MTAKKVCILSFSAIPDDPRVRKQADALCEAGWSVIALGIGTFKSPAPNWHYTQIDGSSFYSMDLPEVKRRENNINILFSSLNKRLSKVKAYYPSQVALIVVKLLRLCDAILFRVPIIGRRRAVGRYWVMRRDIYNFYQIANKYNPDVWLANDWLCLPIAERLAVSKNSCFVYDTHEFAVREYEESFRWRLMQKPLIKQIESQYIPKAKWVSAVSSGIATELRNYYKLDGLPSVFLNVPPYQKCVFKPVDKESIKVLYHGIVSPGRGLEEVILSVVSWKKEFNFTIRGPASKLYLNKLQGLIEDQELTNRVFLEPAIPMVELVERAAEFDVGIFALPGHSLQNSYALPNKFFEYIMAGLALCISDLEEMKKIMKEYDLGIVMDKVSPDKIAKAINSLDKKTIEHYKVNSLNAAKKLNWNSESARFVSQFNSLVVGRK